MNGALDLAQEEIITQGKKRDIVGFTFSETAAHKK